MNLLQRVKVLNPDSFTGKVGVVMDISDAHGLCYGVCFPNNKGAAGRELALPVHWFEPDELEEAEPTITSKPSEGEDDHPWSPLTL